MPYDPGAVEEWLALIPPYDGRVSGSAVCPFRRGVASSEAETFWAFCGGYRVLGFSFLPDWKEAAGLRGPGCPACICIFRAILVP